MKNKQLHVCYVGLFFFFCNFLRNLLLNHKKWLFIPLSRIKAVIEIDQSEVYLMFTGGTNLCVFPKRL